MPVGPDRGKWKAAAPDWSVLAEAAAVNGLTELSVDAVAVREGDREAEAVMCKASSVGVVARLGLGQRWVEERRRRWWLQLLGIL